MKSHPINFYTEEIRALQAGSMSAFIRPMKPQPSNDFNPRVGLFSPTKIYESTGEEYPGKEIFGCYDENEGYNAPYQPGDRLWVRETWGGVNPGQTHGIIRYRADDDDDSAVIWKRSSQMPRWGRRFLLEVTDVRVMRVQEITEEDAKNFGVEKEDDSDRWKNYLNPSSFESPKSSAWSIWENRFGKRFPWSTNPWAWITEFRRVQ
jgi:hypothetical protein